MGMWLGPLVIVAAVLVGGCALRLMDRLEARRNLPPARRRRARGRRPAPFSRALTPSAEKWARIACGGSVRFDDRTIERIRGRM